VPIVALSILTPNLRIGRYDIRTEIDKVAIKIVKRHYSEGVKLLEQSACPDYFFNAIF